MSEVHGLYQNGGKEGRCPGVSGSPLLTQETAAYEWDDGFLCKHRFFPSVHLSWLNQDILTGYLDDVWARKASFHTSL